MNRFWSDKLQGIMTLDRSRELRFREDRKDLILAILGLSPGMRVIDIGCGPGALARKLAAWLGPASPVFGIDRDIVFVQYACQKAKENHLANLSFCEGDALALPFGNQSFDACISHTVIEHVPNREFLLEQNRVCRADGRVSVMIALGDKTIVSSAEGVLTVSGIEKALWGRFDEADQQITNSHGIGSQWVGMRKLPVLFEELGYREIQVDALALPVVPDDARNREG